MKSVEILNLRMPSHWNHRKPQNAAKNKPKKKSKSLPTCLPMSPSHILTESGLVWDCSMSCSIRHWSLRWGSAVAFGRWRLVLGDSKMLADQVDWRRLSGNLFEWSDAPAVSTLQTLCGDLHLSSGATAQGKSPDFSDLVLMDSQTPGDLQRVPAGRSICTSTYYLAAWHTVENKLSSLSLRALWAQFREEKISIECRILRNDCYDSSVLTTLCVNPIERKLAKHAANGRCYCGWGDSTGFDYLHRWESWKKWKKCLRIRPAVIRRTGYYFWSNFKLNSERSTALSLSGGSLRRMFAVRRSVAKLVQLVAYMPPNHLESERSLNNTICKRN